MRKSFAGVGIFATTRIELCPIDKLILYARNPRKNDVAVDPMVALIRQFGFKIHVLARGSDEVVDGHVWQSANCCNHLQGLWVDINKK